MAQGVVDALKVIDIQSDLRRRACSCRSRAPAPQEEFLQEAAVVQTGADHGSIVMQGIADFQVGERRPVSSATAVARFKQDSIEFAVFRRLRFFVSRAGKWQHPSVSPCAQTGTAR